MKKTYKTIKTFVVLLCLLSSGLSAQVNSYVGNGTTYNSSTGYPAPYGNWYWFSKHQMYLSPAELIAAGVAPGATILSFGLNNYSNNSLVSLYQWATAAYTTQAVDPLISGMVTTGQVSSSTPFNSYIPSTGWNTHTLTAFVWNGTDGIVLETCHASASMYTQNASTYWTTNITGTVTVCRWLYADGYTTCQTSGNVGTSTNTRPNLRIDWIGSPCQSSPGINSVVAPTVAICPNASVTLNGLNSYTNSGITYTWQASNVSALGPYTTVATTTVNNYTTPGLTTATWYQVLASCANGGSATTYAAGQVSVQPTTISTVPYFEGFEGITVNNQLPNCSWAVNNSNCQTNVGANTNSRFANTGNNFASVYGYNLTGTNYYYTNGIKLYPGVTYSASMFYTTEYYGYTNFTELSIQLGTTQTPTGLVTIATQTPALSPVYKQLSNTFTVSSAGIYYVAVKVVSTSGSYAYYLSWDDLSITIPCDVASNVPNTAISASSSTICAGQPVNLTASGAATYTWNTGVTGSVLNDVPSINTTYSVTGTSTLTNCSAVVTKFITVKPTPIVSIIPSTDITCAGSPVGLLAIGATSYTWDTGANSSAISVMPNATTVYTVLGSNSFGCSGMTTQMIAVNPSPTIQAITSSPGSCAGAPVTLSGSGATTYQWVSNSAFLQGNPVSVTPQSTTIYTVTGTDDNGCTGSTTVQQTVYVCTGINQVTGSLTGLSIYPNPNNGEFVVSLTNGLNRTIEVMDVTGRVLTSQTTKEDNVNVNINSFSNGVYYVKVKTDNGVNVIKIVKQ